MGFFLNGQHTKTVGLVVETINRPLLPNLKQNMVEIPGKDGTCDFSDGTLEDRIIELECGFTFKNFVELRKKVHQIATFLYSNTYSQIVFDDEPEVYYIAKINNKIDIERIARVAKFNLQLRCKPLAYSIEAKSVKVDSSGNTTITIYNNGTYITDTVIYLKARAICSELTINHSFGRFDWGNESPGNCLQVGDTLKIDSEYVAVSKNGKSSLYSQSGDFVELLEGENIININGFIGDVEIEYRERWL